MSLFEDEIKKKLEAEEKKKLLAAIHFDNMTHAAKQSAIQRGMDAMGKPYSPPAAGKKPPAKSSGGQRMAIDRSLRDKKEEK